MDLLMIRHAKAGERNPETWPDDDLRPLTKEGMAEMRSVLKSLRKMGVVFDVLVTSPLLRARQTAELVAEAWGRNEPPQESDVLGHNCSVSGVVKLLAKFPPDSTVAIVGHEPDFSRVAAQLIGKTGEAAIDLKKGGIIGIAFDGQPAAGAGQLTFLLKPGHLRKLGHKLDRI